MRLLCLFAAKRVFRARSVLCLVLFVACLVAPPGYAAQDQSLQQKLAALEKFPAKFSFVVLGDNRAGDPACDAVYQKLGSLPEIRAIQLTYLAEVFEGDEVELLVQTDDGGCIRTCARKRRDDATTNAFIMEILC